MAASALAMGILGRLLSAAAQRVGTLTFQKIVRLNRVDFALRSGSLRNPAIATLVDDFERVIGTYRGELTIKIDAFLREFERGGLIGAIFENALLNRKSVALRQQFAELFTQVTGDTSKKGELLFEQIETCFLASINELTKDRLLLDAVRVQSAELNDRLDRIEQAFSRPRHKYSGGSNYEDLHPVILKIAKAQLNSYKHIRVETNRGAKLVDITKIYIPSKLRHRKVRHGKEWNQLLRNIFAHAPTARHAMLEYAPTRNIEELIDIVSYSDLRLSFSRVVILGDPGGGKSTLCQFLCQDYARQAVSALQLADKGLTAQLQKVPFRIVLRAYEKARKQEPQLSLFTFIVRDTLNSVTAEYAEVEAALKYLLESGLAVLAFDGLDEILATAQRREFVDLVLSFCNQYPLCPAMVTSRVVGYDSAPLSNEFDTLILQQFEDSEVQDFAKKFFRAVGERKLLEANTLADKFYDQTHSNASDLRKNPLMLGLMAWIFNIRGDVPSNRPEIYKECALLMFERWDPERDIRADIPADFDRLQLFSVIASKIFGNASYSVGVEAAWLQKEIKNYLDGIYSDPAKSFQASKQIVAFITGRAWVMSEMGENVFSFTHQTFLEYFFARHLDDLHDTVEQIFGVIAPKIVEREWDMVSHLALQIKTYRNLRKQDEAIQILLKLLNQESDRSNAAIPFAARSLEYLTGSEAAIKPLISKIVSHALDGYLRGDGQAPKDLERCFEAGPERREFVVQAVESELTRSFTDDNHRAVAGILSLSLPRSLAEKIKSNLKKYISSNLDKDPHLAVYAWDWYGTLSRKTLDRIGVHSLYNTPANEAFDGLDGLSALALAASSAYQRQFMRGAFEHAAANKVLELVGHIAFTRPLKKENFFERPSYGAPLAAWNTVLKEFYNRPLHLAGAMYAMMIDTELRDIDFRLESIEDHSRPKPEVNLEFLARKKKILSKALKSKELNQLKHFDLIKQAVERNSVFSS